MSGWDASRWLRSRIRIANTMRLQVHNFTTIRDILVYFGQDRENYARLSNILEIMGVFPKHLESVFEVICKSPIHHAESYALLSSVESYDDSRMPAIPIYVPEAYAELAKIIGKKLFVYNIDDQGCWHLFACNFAVHPNGRVIRYKSRK